MIKSLGVQHSFQEQTDLKSSIAVTGKTFCTQCNYLKFQTQCHLSERELQHKFCTSYEFMHPYYPLVCSLCCCLFLRILKF